MRDAVDAGLVTAEDNPSLNWKSGGSVGYSTNKRFASRAFNILTWDKGNVITNLAGKYSTSAQQYVFEGTAAPDSDEIYLSSTGHYYKFASGYHTNPMLIGQGKYIGAPSAYNYLNDHYYWARTYYSWSRWQIDTGRNW